MFEIRPYTEDKEQEWNEFVENSKNGTFLFNRKRLPIAAEGELYLVEQWHGDDVLRVGGRVGVDTYCVEHEPRRHLAGVVHSGVGKMFPAHAVVVAHQSVEHCLALLLLSDEVICERHVVVGLVAVAVVAEESCEVPCLISAPWLGEE